MDRVDAPASATHSGKSSLRPWWGAAAAALLAALVVSIALLSGCEVVRSADETRVGQLVVIGLKGLDRAAITRALGG